MEREVGKVPKDLDAEEAVLGSLLIDGLAVKKIDTLAVSDFFSERNQWVYAACLSVKAINQITVAEELDRKKRLEECGGAAYLSHLISIVPTSLDIEHYAEIVHRLSTMRQLINTGSQIATIGYEAGPDVEGSFASAGEILAKLRSGAIPPPDLIEPKDISDRVMTFTQKPERQLTVDWGWIDLDNITGGLYPGELTIIGARPSVGKSEIMIETAVSLAKRYLPSLFVSLEMSLNMLIERLIAMETGIPIMSIRHYDLTPEQRGMVATAAGELSELPLYFLTGIRSTANIAANTRRMKEKHELSVVFVDYLQRLPECYNKKFGENSNKRVGYANSMLKNLTVEMEIPIVLASQLNRELEHRVAKLPKLSDLRESGEIEQDADVVLFLHREELYKSTPENQGIMEIKQAKNRQIGSKPEIKLLWRGHRYVNYSREG